MSLTGVRRGPKSLGARVNIKEKTKNRGRLDIRGVTVLKRPKLTSANSGRNLAMFVSGTGAKGPHHQDATWGKLLGNADPANPVRSTVRKFVLEIPVFLAVEDKVRTPGR